MRVHESRDSWQDQAGPALFLFVSFMESLNFPSGIVMKPPGRSILLCIDGSEESAHAVFAICPFLRENDKVTIFTAYTPVSGWFVSTKVKEAKLQSKQHQANQLVACARETLATHSKVPLTRISSHIEITSTIAETIENFAIAYNFDLIVLGSRGLSRFKRLILGSVSEHIAKCAPSNSSVMIVNSALPDNANDLPLRIFLLYDGTDPAERAARWIGKYARPIDQITVYMVGLVPSRYQFFTAGASVAVGGGPTLLSQEHYDEMVQAFQNECQETVNEGRILVLNGGIVRHISSNHTRFLLQT